MSSFSKPLAALALLPAVAGIAGCFSTPATYPDHWAERKVANDGTCPDFDGTYRNEGEFYPPSEGVAEAVPEARSLAHILNGGIGVDKLDLWNKLGLTNKHPGGDPNDIVRLSLADGSLYVTAFHQDGSSRTLELRVGSRCRDGLLALDHDWDTDVELISPVAPEFSRKSVALGRAGDGSLLVRESKTAAQWFLLTPAFGYREAAWIRFDPVATAAMAQAGESP